jgi:hypothetical protein
MPKHCSTFTRADEELFIEFCEDFDMQPILFEAFQTVDGENENDFIIPT